MYLVFFAVPPSRTDLSETSLRTMKVVNGTHSYVFGHSAPLFQVPIVSWAMPSNAMRCQAMPSDSRRFQPFGTGGLQVLGCKMARNPLKSLHLQDSLRPKYDIISHSFSFIIFFFSPKFSFNNTADFQKQLLDFFVLFNFFPKQFLLIIIFLHNSFFLKFTASIFDPI